MMKRRINRVAILAAVVFMTIGFAAYGQDVSASSVIPREFLRSWDPLTLIFDKNIGPAGGGPADDPGTLFTLEPDQAGEYRWLDEKTLQFLPADPWPPFASITVRSGLSRWVLQTLISPPESVSPRSGSSNLSPLSRIEMVLSQRVDPERLRDMIEIEVRPLPGLEGQQVQRIDQDQISVRIMDPRSESSRVTAVVELTEPIGYGNRITFSLHLAEGAAAQAFAARYEFSTRPVFRLTDMGSGNYRFPVSENGSIYSVDRAVEIQNRNTPIFLQFSENLDSLSMEEVRRMLRFTPAVRNFSYEVSGNRLYIHLDADSQTPYKIRINHESILSSSGRVLAPFDESGFSFYFNRLQAYLKWERGDAVVERYGPRVFPMEGRGVSRVDLRVYSIDPLDRQFWPFGSNPLSINEESRPPMPGESVNTMERAIRSLGSPEVSTIIKLPISESAPATEFGLDLAPYLEKISGPDAPGTYLVGYRALGSDSTRQYVRMVVTDLDLTVVEEEHGITFVVTSLSTGRPVKGAEILIEGQENNSSEYVTVVQGTTDSTGRFHYNHQKTVEETLRRIILRKGDDVLVFDPSNPPPAFRNNHWFGSSTRWLSWLNREPVTRREEAAVRAYILSERPIYRPEEAVHILGYVRARKAGEILRDDRDTERRLDVSGPGDRTWTFPVELDEFGQFSVDFQESDVPTGFYTALLYDNDLRGTLATTQFQIESYRVPRFEVQIHGEDRVPVDEPFTLSLVAEYYAGGRVSGRPVFWRVTEQTTSMRPVGYEGFSFSSYESIGGGYDGRSSGLTRQNTTDENGLATLRIDPGARRNPTAIRYLVEGTVEGADGQSVTAVKSVQALPPFSIGIRQERFVRAGQELNPEVVVIDFDGEPAAGRDFTLRIYQRQWHSYLVESDFVTGEAEYRSDIVDELILEERHTSVAGAMEFSYPLEESGVYIIELLARDELGRLQTVRVDCYVPGTSPMAWERSEGNVFQTTTDKDSYVPGDVARVLLQSPFQEATALAVIEGPLSVSYQWVEITGGQAVFELPIHARMVPRIPVHFLLIRGRVPGTENRYTPSYDRGRPIALANTTYLNVLPVEHTLNVNLSYPAQALPGSTVEVDILLTDSRGKPVNGQVALWLVDRAVLSLAAEKKIDPLSAFIDPVDAAVTIRNTRNQVVGNLPFKENPGGGGWDESAAAREANLLDRTTVRKNFQTVPYYNPRIPVKDGRGRVEITLPDNLTDFAVRAVAVSGYGAFGTASGLLSVRLPVIVQTALPRFVRPGDLFSAGGIARIVEGSGGQARIQVRSKGMNLPDGSSEALRTVILDFGIASPQYFSFAVPRESGGEEVTVTMGVERIADGVSDAFEVSLPVRSGTFDERHVRIVRPETDGTEAFPVEGPYRRGSLRQNLTVSFEEEALHLLGSSNYLSTAGGRTTEQRANALRAAFLLDKLFGSVELPLESRPDRRGWEEFQEYLLTVRTAGDLYAQFPGGTGLVSLTAWILETMVLASEAGLETGEAVYNRTVKALQEALRSDYRYLISEYSYQERVEALSALAGAGYFDDAYGQSLLTSGRGKDLYAVALLVACYAREGRADQGRVESLVDYLWDATVFRLEGGNRYFTGLSHPASRWGGYLMTSDTRTLAAVIRALAMVDPDDPRLSLMTDYLLRRGTGRGWGNSAETAEAVGALIQILTEKKAEAQANQRFTLSFGRDEISLDTEGRRISGISVDYQVPGTVRRSRGSGEYPWLYLSADYRPDLLPSAYVAGNNGFVINRELQVVENDRVVRRIETDGNPMEVGKNSLLEEHITVANPSDRYYVAVRIPLAAGCEPLNPELETSGAEARTLGSATRQPTHARYLDDEVIYYFEKLPEGIYHFYFRERAIFPGAFQLPPAVAEALYDTGVRGNTAGAILEVSEE